MTWMMTAVQYRQQLVGKLTEARAMSDWYFDGGEWWLAEQWHIHAAYWQQQLDDLTAEMHPTTEGSQ